jgi:DNA-binding LacI/PurR family transcriptional regulator
MNKNSRSINIHSIAKEVGVSVATISRFFNNPDVVKENTKNKIIDVCKKYNYTPSKIARAITTKKTKLIAFIMPSLKDPAFIDIIAGAEKAMSKKGYILCLFNTRQNINREKDIVETIQSMNIDGVMFSCIYGNKEEEKFLLNLQKKDIPIILVDRIIPEVNLPYVMHNDFLGGQIAAKFLMDNNHKKIGILSYSMQVYIFRQRVEGFLKVLNENQIKESFIIEVPLEYKNIEDTVDKNIDLMLESGVTAIFCVSDSIAIFLSRLLVEKKIMIPEQISVAGFDNIVFSNFSIPRLTTIDHDMFSLGEKAAENLIFKLETGRFKNKNEVIDPVLIKRDSVRKI